MKNDHTYEYRVFTNRLVDVGPMEVGNCTKKVVDNLKSKDKVDGRFFHTSDTDEWFFCWDGKLQKLNLSGDASVNDALDEVKKLIGDANDAVKQALEAAKSANDAAVSIENKANQDYVDAVKQDVESLEQEVSKKANQTAVDDLAQKVESKASISDLDNKADRSELKGLATESYVVTKIAEAKLEGSDITIPVQDVKVNGQTVVKDMIADIDLTPYAKTEDVPSIEGFATEQWVTDQKYLTQHQDISHLASTTYVDGKVASIEIPSVEGLATKQEVAAVVVGYATETWVSDQGFLTEETLKNSTVISDINSQISEINTLLGDVKLYITKTILA